MNQVDRELERLVRGELTVPEMMGNWVRGLIGWGRLTGEERAARLVERRFNKGKPVFLQVDQDAVNPWSI